MSDSGGRTPDEREDGYDDELTRAARALPRGIAPPRDLWPGIERAIGAGAARPAAGGWRRDRLLAQAAAVVLLVGGSSGVTWLALEDGAPAGAPDGAAETVAFESVAGNFGGRYHLGPEFVDARTNLASGLDRKLDRLPPETRLAVEQNIADIRAAISEINRALADEPDNALLQDLLQSAYRDELTLMKKVDVIATSAMNRTDI
jgi:hypothetical protein